MTWSVITPHGEDGTQAATVVSPCIVEFGRIIGRFETLANAQRAAAAVNAALAAAPPADSLDVERLHTAIANADRLIQAELVALGQDVELFDAVDLKGRRDYTDLVAAEYAKLGTKP